MEGRGHSGPHSGNPQNQSTTKRYMEHNIIGHIHVGQKYFGQTKLILDEVLACHFKDLKPVFIIFSLLKLFESV